MSLTKEQKLLFIAAGIITLIGIISIHITFNYMDTQTLMVWAVNNWDLLFEGRMSDFYTDKTVGMLGYIRGASPEAPNIEGSANPLMFIPQMLWCFPIWVTHYFNGNTYIGTLGCVYWYKLFLVLMTGVCAYYCYRIVKRISGDDFRACLAILIVMASSEVLLSTGYSGQDEIVYLSFTLIAIERLICDRYRQFIIWSTVAVTLCPLVILPLATALVLKQKNLLRIIADLILMMIPTGLWAVISRNMTRTYEGHDHIGQVFDYIQLPLVTHGHASVFIIFLVLLLFYCYLRQETDTSELVWFTSLSVIWMSYLTDSYFYRLMLYIPFMAIMITSAKDDNLSLKVLLITILEYARFFSVGIDNKIVMNTYYTVDSGWLKAICARAGSDQHTAYQGFVEQFFVYHPSLPQFAAVLNGVIFAIILILLWITRSSDHERISSKCNIRGLYVYVIVYSLCIPIYTLMFWHYAMRCF